MKQAQANATGICHFRIDREVWLRDYLASLPIAEICPETVKAQVDFWLYQGCVYINGVRQRQDILLQRDQVLRLHTRPKTFFWDPVNLRDQIVFEDDELLVFDKPAGMPVHATLDNYIQNAKFLLEAELGHTIYSTHRLDVGTHGLLIFAKNKSAQAIVNKRFANGEVEKIYQALSSKPVALGLHTLFINPETRVPREHSFEPREGWWHCRLEVLEHKTLAPRCEWHRIRLLTGKTHQIRAQFAALGSPLLGDATYGSKEGVHEQLALECFSLSFTFRSRTVAIQRPRSTLQAPPLT